MSLLEDVFLHDEANEAQELERVIEGDEYDERPRSDSDDNSEQENEAEEDKRRIDPASTKTRRVIKNPRFVLNPARLTGPRGIHVIPEHFKDFKFKAYQRTLPGLMFNIAGKGHEKEDLDLVMKKLEHWAYRLYPKFQFEDCLKKIEILGKKRPVMVNLQKIRSDQFTSEEPVVQKDSSEDEAPQDEFDKLLQQQIDLARATENSKTDKLDSPVRDHVSSFTLPKATSSPSINDEQKERMMRNRKMAEERRLARLKSAANTTNNTENIPGLSNNNKNEDNNSENVITNDFNIDADMRKARKSNRSNVIDSSDEDVEVNSESIIVDVHNYTNTGVNSHNEEELNVLDKSKNDKNINNDTDKDIYVDNNDESNDKSNNKCKENHENRDTINDENKDTSNEISENVNRSTEQGDKDTDEVTSKDATLFEKKSNEIDSDEELMDIDFENV